MQLEYAEKEDSYLRSKEVCYKILSFSFLFFMFMALYSLSGYFAVTFETHLPDCVDPENIHTPPKKGFCFAPPPSPEEIPVLLHTLLLKLWVLMPLLLGISSDLRWGGYGFFLELHIASNCNFHRITKGSSEPERGDVIKSLVDKYERIVESMSCNNTDQL